MRTALAVLAPVLRLATISVALATSACVIPYALPPLKAEAGGVTVAGAKPMFHAGGGAHLASGVLDKQQRYDVGIGGFVENSEDGVETVAAYAETSMFIDKGERARTSVGVRGELRWSPENLDGIRRRGVGAKLRVEREFFGTTSKGYSGADKCVALGGAAHGTGAIGVFAEAGSVMMPGHEPAFTATAGLTLRVPSTIGIIVGIPGC